MLILTRRVGEALIIGEDIEVHVLGVKGGQVRIGVKAPNDVTVHREEVHARIVEEMAGKGLDGPKNKRPGVKNKVSNEADTQFNR